MELELFQTTVKEYKRFTQQLPINYSNAVLSDFLDSIYVAAQTRLMLLRKYTRKGRGNLYLTNIVTEAIRRFPGHSDYLSEFQARFQQSCDQSLNHSLADGTERTLDESIDDTMYGLHLHADEERIYRIAQDNELLRLFCVVTFVKEIEALVIELSDFFEVNGVTCIEKAHHFRAPVIHLESQDSDAKNITGSPFWCNLIGSDITEESTATIFTTLLEQYTFEEKQLWATACAFTQLLAQEQFSYDEMKRLVFEPNIYDWGDFSKAVAYYKAIPSPGMSSVIRYNQQRDTAYIHIYPRVEKGFIVDSPQITSDVYMITLVKDQRVGEWRVFAFGGRVDPFIRD
ncbi:hypothetical protein DFR58_12921 [Anaerobacterium chartisolvens]|uniref:Uncharacterized protein n=1 Tax=Anaerobacterium chartisolvens TaxID=1297424 RepID=A0A369AM14_9FIRM|nr:hypothetical protein [Anaerobacterium chartisolvens]RCX10429.1 hypothetical protein DFR58_12921 [Anaerobacterium chartisolvens]